MSFISSKFDWQLTIWNPLCKTHTMIILAPAPMHKENQHHRSPIEVASNDADMSLARPVRSNLASHSFRRTRCYPYHLDWNCQRSMKTLNLLTARPVSRCCFAFSHAWPTVPIPAILAFCGQPWGFWAPFLQGEVACLGPILACLFACVADPLWSISPTRVWRLPRERLNSDLQCTFHMYPLRCLQA